jgi:tripartite-type tricarboxylate transporter receptor subunit TctC
MAHSTRRRFLGGITALAVAPARAGPNWPERAVTLVHGFPPGGPVDTAARILAEGLSLRLGQPVIVEPKAGATGAIAAAHVARAANDGYTLLNIPASYTATAAIYRTLPYRPIDDFTMVSTTVGYPMVLATHAGHPMKTLSDLVSLARSKSAPLQYGTAGSGSLQHLAMELFAKVANIELQHIPYRGGAPAIMDLLGERVDFVPDPPTALMEYIRDGRLRAVAVTSESRYFALPDVPTVAEGGFPGYAVEGFQGIAAPAGLDGAIVAKLNRAIAEVVADPAVVERLKKLGNRPRPSAPDEMKTVLALDIERWGKVVEHAHIERM